MEEVNVRFVFPDDDSGTYLKNIENINEDIVLANRKPSYIRFAIFILSLFFTIILFFLFGKLSVYVVRFITGSGYLIILSGLLLMLLALILVFKLPAFFYKYICLFLERYFGVTIEETFSFSIYTKRNDTTKLVANNFISYKRYEVLREHEIYDVALSCINGLCRIDVSYEDNGHQIMSFSMPYRTSKNVDNPVVDFAREYVIFPRK